jgi:hypothetical protein
VYRPNSFTLAELVPPDIYAALGDRAWELLDPMALMSLQSIRNKFGPIVVNNWRDGGAYKESGLRSATSATGAKFSQHRYGRAFDCKSTSVSPQEMCDFILKSRKDFPYITCIENPEATPTWLHFDTRNHQRDGIWIVNP